MRTVKSRSPLQGDVFCREIKDTFTITLRKGNTQRSVVYNEDTKFTLHNKPSSLDDLKEGRRLICLGTFDEKTRLVATRIDVRTENP